MIKDLLDNAVVYRMWQAPFVSQKIAPVLRSGAISRAWRVLDLGCGPGTNAGLFVGREYVGVDAHPRYIAAARERFPHGDFLVRDVTQGLDDLGIFDLVLSNSLLHHLDDGQVETVLTAVSRVLSPDGEAHILDLVLPESGGLPRLLALADRGHHPRSERAWEDIVDRFLDHRSSTPYSLKLGPVTCWRMLHLVCKIRV